MASNNKVTKKYIRKKFFQKCIVDRCEEMSQFLYNGVNGRLRSFFRFPTQESRKEEWIKILNLDSTKLPHYSKVCELHFENDQFINRHKIHLKSTALPTATKIESKIAIELLPTAPVPVPVQEISGQRIEVEKIETKTLSKSSVSKSKSKDCPASTEKKKIKLGSCSICFNLTNPKTSCLKDCETVVNICTNYMHTLTLSIPRSFNKDIFFCDFCMRKALELNQMADQLKKLQNSVNNLVNQFSQAIAERRKKAYLLPKVPTDAVLKPRVQQKRLSCDLRVRPEIYSPPVMGKVTTISQENPFPTETGGNFNEIKIECPFGDDVFMDESIGNLDIRGNNCDNKDDRLSFDPFVHLNNMQQCFQETKTETYSIPPCFANEGIVKTENLEGDLTYSISEMDFQIPCNSQLSASSTKSLKIAEPKILVKNKTAFLPLQRSNGNQVISSLSRPTFCENQQDSSASVNIGSLLKDEPIS